MKRHKLQKRAFKGFKHIVRKSHQINAEDHLEPLFWKAFEKGLNYETSHDAKVRINGLGKEKEQCKCYF